MRVPRMLIILISMIKDNNLEGSPDKLSSQTIQVEMKGNILWFPVEKRLGEAYVFCGVGSGRFALRLPFLLQLRNYV